MNREQFQKRLTAIPPAERRKLEAQYWENFRPRADGGVGYSLDDHLWQTFTARRHGLATAKLAALLDVTISYVEALQAALVLSSEKMGT